MAYRHRGGGGRPRERERGKSDVYLSKSLSTILRHQAHEMGLDMKPGGFIAVKEILTKSWLSSGGYTIEDVQKVVVSDDKQRFMIQDNPSTGELEIRANQGHSFMVADMDFKPITDHTLYPEVIHGTYAKSWNFIKAEGLKRMGRTHIHFAPGEPHEDGVISGMRQSCVIIIFIDMEKALAAGIKFSLSANNVILSEGEGDTGCIRPRFFSKVIQRRPRRCEIAFDKGE